MGRSSRVLSFISQFGSNPRPTGSSSSSPAPLLSLRTQTELKESAASLQNQDGSLQGSPSPRARHERAPSRPMSMLQTYQPPLMDVAQDTLPELQPIFTFLNSHSNKLYHEGYLFKLNDIDPSGKPSSERNWKEYFAQLVGTIVSLWDAAALDAAGRDGEVVPTFINLTDASIKIDTFDTQTDDGSPIQNVLSVNTAGLNRYRFHFNSHHSLVQWTASIRLAMYEHATLQEAYTGSLIAGKGKALPNIRMIMERTRFKTEDWARVRFGAGTPWIRCWCVITPPNEKLVSKQQRQFKKKSAYDTVNSLPKLKGDIKFYDSKKTKKAKLIATITDAYSAYAIYPQSKPLIDQSTLVKLEGTITIHSRSANRPTEGFVFVMPEAHAGLPGFEMMLRWLFPVYDTFALYGRPQALVADIRDPRGLMFAMPREKRYGYLETIDVVTLINTEGSEKWTESQWRKNMKELTSRRMTSLSTNTSRPGSIAGSRRGLRNSVLSRSVVTFDDNHSTKSNPSLGQGHRPPQDSQLNNPSQTGPALSTANGQSLPHRRSSPESQARDRYQDQERNGSPPPPPPHSSSMNTPYGPPQSSGTGTSRITEGEVTSFGGEVHPRVSTNEMQFYSGPEPVAPPPAFAHGPGSAPPNLPQQSPELRKINNRISANTLALLSAAGGVSAAGTVAAWRSGQDRGEVNEDREPRYDAYGNGSRGVRSEGDENAPPISYGVVHDGMTTSEDRFSGQGHHPLPPPPHAQPFQPSFDPSRFSPDGSTINPHNQPLKPQDAWQNTQGPPVHTDPLHGSDEAAGPPPRRYSYEKEYYESPDRSLDQDLSDPPPLKGQASGTQSSRQLPALETDASALGNSSPNRAQSTKSNHVETPVTASDSSSLRRHVFNQGALDQIIARSESPEPENTIDMHRVDMRRQPSSEGSYYDNDTTTSPDYASTRKSSETKRSAVSVEKPRAGVMRTVGSTEEGSEVVVGDAHYKLDPQAAVNSGLIEIDFGPTYNYAAGPQGRPGTSGTLTQSMHDRSKSSGSRDLHSAGSGDYGLREGSPVTADEMKRQNSYGFTAGKGSPGNHSREQSRPPSRNLTTPDPYRSSPSGIDPDGRRSMIWQPGTAVGGSPGWQGGGLTAEQFVQQRAAQTQVRAMPGHQRNQSSNSLGMITPPPNRIPSGEGPALPKTRNGSADHPPRPHSRGAFVSQGTGGYPTHLSAREQEFVAKVTGSPLINMAGGNSAQQAPSAGLVGAIEARQREKKEIKDGVSGQMVQHAVAQRQQQVQGNSYGRTSPIPSFGGMLPAGAIPQGQFSPGLASQPRGYAQGGGWNFSQRSPQEYQPAQQQYGAYSGANQQGRNARS
ncbi:hypothetical protein GP486_006861 [Trichoglossum hirsutum]|uniref:PH domain-containing protein n=1 Tax=Trichoglossum hirsutum TaxID=265104 RepID=A0A9P8L598_9PEZI|nr:hypothetical protein GP486_006861 [Trichoglossum hirsutum]